MGMKLLSLLESIIQYLYHYTKADAAIRILQQNQLGTDSRKFVKGGFFNRASFTRDGNYQWGFPMLRGVVFVVDGIKLKQRYRLTPRRGDEGEDERECEEQTDKPITNFSQYVVKMILYSYLLEEKDLMKLKTLAQQRSIPVTVLHNEDFEPLTRKHVA